VSEVEHLQRELADTLGGQLSATWRDSYLATPRHLFLPDRVWLNLNESLDRHADPDRWLGHAYRDESIITQLHDGAEASDSGYRRRPRRTTG